MSGARGDWPPYHRIPVTSLSAGHRIEGLGTVRAVHRSPDGMVVHLDGEDEPYVFGSLAVVAARKVLS